MSRSAVVVALLLLVTVCSVAGQVSAQEVPRGAYVSGGLLLLHVNGESGDTTNAVKQVGGVGLGWHAAFGGFLTPRVSFEAEISQTGRLSASVLSSEQFERRDTLFGGVFRVHLAPGRRVDPEVVGGFHMTHTQRWQTLSWDVTGTHERGADWNSGFSAGFDVRVGGPRFAVVPGFRLDWTSASDPMYNYWDAKPLNSTWMVSGSVSVRVKL
jgi:hypothetical protein